MSENQNEQDTIDVKTQMTTKKSLIIIIVALIIIMLVVTGLYFYFKPKLNTVPNEIETKPVELNSEYKMSGNDLQDFDLSFLKLESSEKNMVYSPLSIKYALEMLSDGTSGRTKQQIDAILGEYSAKKYQNSANMSFANSMFIRNTIKDSIKDTYIADLNSKYNASIIYDEFADANNINKWISDNTFKLINDLVDDVNNKDFFLVNALAIDMEWNKVIQMTTNAMLENDDNQQYVVDYQHEDYFSLVDLIVEDSYGSIYFNNKTDKIKAAAIAADINNYDIVSELGRDNIEKQITEEYTKWLNESDDECVSDAETNIKKFVNNFIDELDSNYGRAESSTDFKLYSDDDVKLFSKELKKYNDTTLEYVGIMPIKESLSEYIKNSTSSSISSTVDKLKTIASSSFEQGKVTKIVGGIPFFAYDYQLDLINDLKKVGVEDVFDAEKADMTKMTNTSNAYINEASHKAKIEFSNEGIKAAAATVEGGLGSTSCGFEHLYELPIDKIDITFNKPFMYLIRDKDTKEVWFVGSVYEPIVNTNEYSSIISND